METEMIYGYVYIHTQLLIEGVWDSVLGSKVSGTHRVCQEIDAVFGRNQTL